MNKYSLLLSIVLIFLIINPSYNQEDQQNETSLQKALTGFQEADSKELERLFVSDVFQYYDLDKEYDTPLKKKVYQNSKEYKEKIQELTKLRNDAIKPTYYVSTGLVDKNLGDAIYDLKTKSLIIPIQAQLFYIKPIIDNCDEYIFTNLSAKIHGARGDQPYDVTVYVVGIFLQMNEKSALNIENNLDSCKLYIVFKLTGRAKKLNFYARPPDYSYALSTKDFVEAVISRMIIANDSTGEVYYSKNL